MIFRRILIVRLSSSPCPLKKYTVRPLKVFCRIFHKFHFLKWQSREKWSTRFRDQVNLPSFFCWWRGFSGYIQNLLFLFSNSFPYLCHKPKTNWVRLFSESVRKNKIYRFWEARCKQTNVYTKNLFNSLFKLTLDSSQTNYKHLWWEIERARTEKTTFSAGIIETLKLSKFWRRIYLKSCGFNQAKKTHQS